MKSMDKDRLIYGISCICMALLSITILFMPLTASHTSETIRYPLYINGIAFWIFSLSGYSLLVALNIRRNRNSQAKAEDSSGKKRLPGIISFFSNPYAKVIDTIFILSLLVFIYYQARTYIDGILSYVLLSLLIFMFHMHCMFNGKNFYYIQNKG